MWPILLSSERCRIAMWRASSAEEVWRLAKAVLGRPKCNLETKRVDRRPEKSAERSDLVEGGREEREGKLGLVEVEVVVVVVVGPGGGLAACRGGGFLREVHWC